MGLLDSFKKPAIPVGTVMSDLEKLARREIQLDEQRRAVSAQKFTAEGIVANRLVESDDASSEIEALRALELRERDLLAAGASCHGRRAQAIVDGYVARAKEVRAIALAKRTELDTIEERTSNLLAALSAIENITFTSAILGREVRDHLGCFVPRSAALLGEIQKLEAEAMELEKKPLRSDGHVDLDNQTDAEGLRLAVLLHESAAPSVQVIDAWLVDCVDGRNVALGTRPRRFRLSWRAGKIDNESFIFVPGLAPARRDESRAGAGFDTERATFRAAVRQ